MNRLAQVGGKKHKQMKYLLLCWEDELKLRQDEQVRTHRTVGAERTEVIWNKTNKADSYLFLL